MLFRIIRRLRYFDETPIQLLGRWSRTDAKQNNWKVDMANSDHCGDCSAKEVEFYSTISEHNNIPTIKLKEGVIKTQEFK